MSFGGEAIDKELYDEIVKILPEGKTILELGSGDGTEELAKKWKVYSIEDNTDWVDKYDSTYIHAPLIDNWYDTSILEKEIPKDYDLVLIDGPRTGKRRLNMIKHFHLFRKDVPWIFDDTNNGECYRLAKRASEYIGREIKQYKGNKRFAII